MFVNILSLIVSEHQRSQRSEINITKLEMKKVDAFVYLKVLIFDLLPCFFLFGKVYFERIKLYDMKILFKVCFVNALLIFALRGNFACSVLLLLLISVSSVWHYMLVPISYCFLFYLN